jgi:hemerythrin-like domain-containing protein
VDIKQTTEGDVSTEKADSVAIAETRLLHKMHRAATTLLADAAPRETAPAAALAELRDFLVAALRHHHESEDHVLWPRLIAASPAAGAGLIELSAEHDALDAALTKLADVAVQGDEDRAALAAAAAHVRDLVHHHLESEEPVLFPALAEHMPDHVWSEFARATIASAPPVAAHLNFGFFDQVGTAAEVEAVMVNVPQELLPIIPAMREQARATLDSLRGTDHGRTATS